MKYILLIATLMSSVAFARPSSWTMTCAQAQNLVRQNGAVVMNYGYSDRAGYLYERFVSNHSYCGMREWAKRALVSTKDSSRCFIGYTCETRTDD